LFEIKNLNFENRFKNTMMKNDGIVKRGHPSAKAPNNKLQNPNKLQFTNFRN